MLLLLVFALFCFVLLFNAKIILRVQLESYRNKEEKIIRDSKIFFYLVITKL